MPHIVESAGIVYDADDNKAKGEGKDETEERKKDKKDKAHDKPCGEAVQPDKGQPGDEGKDAEGEKETHNEAPGAVEAYGNEIREADDNETDETSDNGIGVTEAGTETDRDETDKTADVMDDETARDAH